MYEQVFGQASGVSGMLRERAAVLAVTIAMGRDAHRASAMIEATGSAIGLLRGRLNGLDRWELPLAERLRGAVGPADIERQEALIASLQGSGFRVVTVLDEDYPTNLRTVYNLPSVLFMSGMLMRGRRAAAIVGTRHASGRALRCADGFAAAVAARGIGVVSGLGLGIDARVHRAALAAGGVTIAVMGTGIDRVYLPQSHDLAEEIAASGALVSQFWPGTLPSRHTFALRNAVLSGLSTAVVVVEGRPGSLASMLAGGAMEQAKPVFFVDGLAAEEGWARRCLEQGMGRVLRSADELVETVDCLTDTTNEATLT